MKEIKAYIRQLGAYRVIKDLERAGAKDLTLLRVEAIGPPTAHPGSDADATFAKFITKRSPMAKLELVCRDEEARSFVEIIRAGAHTGKRGDGRIFISQVDGVVNIRNGETGEAAL